MMYLDLAMRGGAITVLLLLAVLLFRAPIGWEGRLSVTAVALAEAAFLITTTAFPIEFHPLALANLTLLASLAPVAITWLIVTIFLDAPGLRWPWIAGGGITSAALYAHWAFPEIGFPRLPFAIALYGALVLLAVWSARDDLVECRCRARPVFAVAIAGLALILTSTQALGWLEESSLAMALLHGVGTLGVTIAFAVWLLRPDVGQWPGETMTAPDKPAPMAAQSGMDSALIARIKAAMAAGIWLDEGLTIGALASHLAVPEHRLRRAINQGLGHRNFSSFINRARIEAACAVLGDPARMNVTVLEVAYDVGFASVGPFNRAFRAEKGVSPSEYRRLALSGDIADSGNAAPIPVNLH